ncbi:hypothetical protein PUNSTDRAFT_145474 [Punctularia strigosozonata HHB-11173 SS5]|uniref:uncharacterized protein n=1 Tax=Punctularia strigosozonata (strain HHB-11173) TaxID=741275 RepID=UPI00044169C5|nr:uncharacterized protein PUNSTDRAFT_145474 [Punctularia strigosozonata HHB-11173 SS5]EIN06143.1 hypothetical protein PUNSTDRAFT_145474 [Punctularia strigosozonata HHB-11173 SS5]
MSLPSTSTLRAQLNSTLGDKAPAYWRVFKEFLAGHISRNEFDAAARRALDTPHLVQLHNALVISLFDTSVQLDRRAAAATDAATPAAKIGDGAAPASAHAEKPRKSPPKKRRRLLPYQGEDADMDSLRSARFRKWVVGLGRKERARLQHLPATPIDDAAATLRKLPQDEILQERGVQLLPERGEPPGSRLPLHLAAVTRAPTLQHISDRINLICAQHNLGAPSKAVSSLLMLAFEAKLKQLISQAITLTSASHAITSIQPAHPSGASYNGLLAASAFDALFTVSPAVLPNRSAAAMRLALGAPEGEDGWAELERLERVRGRVPEEGARDDQPGWQILALLAQQRSAVREVLNGAR